MAKISKTKSDNQRKRARAVLMIPTNVRPGDEGVITLFANMSQTLLALIEVPSEQTTEAKKAVVS